MNGHVPIRLLPDRAVQIQKRLDEAHAALVTAQALTAEVGVGGAPERTQHLARGAELAVDRARGLVEEALYLLTVA